jgi:small subunit ribosomal protein S8
MDRISNLLIALKNGGNAKRPTATVPFSKLQASIAKVLFDAGYIASYSKKAQNGHDVLELGIAYVQDKPRINDVKRISKPSRRLYAGAHQIRTVKSGHGILVLSTPKGILTGDQAKSEHVGGETLFEIW